MREEPKIKSGILRLKMEFSSYKLGAYYVNSYKKLDQKAHNLEITSFTGIRAKIWDFTSNLFF